nr:hypothetical protein CFP56_66400 [Quercus suber]
MTTRFSKQKLAETQEKKARGGIIGGLLSRKSQKVGDALFGVLVVTPPSTHSPAQRLPSPTSSLEAFGESLFVSRKHLDLEKKVATAEPMIKSLFAENETLKNKVAILIVEAENDKEHVTTLEKSLQEFKESDLYSDDLCKYYVEGFELLRRWMAKHHLELNLSGLVMGEVEKEFVADRPSEVTKKNVVEETTTAAPVDSFPCDPTRQ